MPIEFCRFNITWSYNAISSRAKSIPLHIDTSMWTRMLCLELLYMKIYQTKLERVSCGAPIKFDNYSMLIKVEKLHLNSLFCAQILCLRLLNRFRYKH